MGVCVEWQTITIRNTIQTYYYTETIVVVAYKKEDKFYTLYLQSHRGNTENTTETGIRLAGDQVE